MVRQGVRARIGCVACAVLLVGCGDEIATGPPSGQGGAGSGGAAGGGAPNIGGSVGCTSVCCPDEAACFSDSSLGKSSPGAECAATRANDEEHIQLRQQWIRATTPAGNRIRDIYAILAGRTQLAWPACKQSGAVGTGGHIQLLEYVLPGGPANLENHYSLSGYAQYVPATAVPSIVSDGFCFGEESYAGDPAYALRGSELSPSNDYPAGLPKPMGLQDGPWRVTPTRAKRLAEDFDVNADRIELLSRIETELKPQGYDAVFYYDPARGYAHGYAPLSWTIVYTSNGAGHIAIPIREAETKLTFNDPGRPNCVGGYRGNTITTCTAGQQDDPPWGCIGDACPVGESPSTTGGYFLIAELEQIYAEELLSTLCVSYPLREKMQEEGFYNEELRSCRTAKWDPTKLDQSGLPQGDWCARTNGPRTDTCHDAWRNLSYHAYAGARIREGTTCAF